MTREETVIIIRSMMAAYPNFRPQNITETVDVWHAMTADVDYQMISLALKTYIRSNTSKFAPSISELMEEIRKLSGNAELNEIEAWSMVKKALRNSAYNSEHEFAKLPEAIQRTLGGASALRDMAVTQNKNENVESSNFMRTYRTVIERQKQEKALPQEIVALLSVKKTTAIEMKEEPISEEKKEYVVPAWVEKKISEFMQK